MNISEMLKVMRFKPQVLVTVGPAELSSVAVQKMADYNKGALPVCNDDGELVGIVTERDILRKCFVRKGEFKDKKVNDEEGKDTASAGCRRQKNCRHSFHAGHSGIPIRRNADENPVYADVPPAGGGEQRIHGSLRPVLSIRAGAARAPAFFCCTPFLPNVPGRHPLKLSNTPPIF
jgi:hypothetical protein